MYSFIDRFIYLYIYLSLISYIHSVIYLFSYLFMYLSLICGDMLTKCNLNGLSDQEESILTYLLASYLARLRACFLIYLVG